MSVNYEYDFTTGLYRARVKTKYRRADMSMSDWIYSGPFEFRKLKNIIHPFKYAPNIIIDPENYICTNAILIREGSFYKNYLKYRIYDNDLCIFYTDNGIVDTREMRLDIDDDIKYIYLSFDRTIQNRITFYDAPNACEEIIIGSKNNKIQSSNVYFLQCNCNYQYFNPKRIDLSKINTSIITDINYGFYNMYNLKEFVLDFSSLNNVTIAHNMFADCRAIEQLDLSNWDVSNVENIANMFLRCVSLKYLNLNNWDLRHLSTHDDIFIDCNSLLELRCPLYAYDPGSSSIDRIPLPKTMYDINGNSYTTLPGGNITLYATNPVL